MYDSVGNSSLILIMIGNADVKLYGIGGFNNVIGYISAEDFRCKSYFPCVEFIEVSAFIPKGRLATYKLPLFGIGRVWQFCSLIADLNLRGAFNLEFAT